MRVRLTQSGKRREAACCHVFSGGQNETETNQPASLHTHARLAILARITRSHQFLAGAKCEVQAGVFRSVGGCPRAWAAQPSPKGPIGHTRSHKSIRFAEQRVASPAPFPHSFSASVRRLPIVESQHDARHSLPTPSSTTVPCACSAPLPSLNLAFSSWKHQQASFRFRSSLSALTLNHFLGFRHPQRYELGQPPSLFPSLDSWASVLPDGPPSCHTLWSCATAP